MIKDRELDEDEVWKGEEYGARFELSRMEGDRFYFLTIRGRSLKGRHRLLADFIGALGEPTLPGDGLPKQKLFTWSTDSAFLGLKELLANDKPKA